MTSAALCPTATPGIRSRPLLVPDSAAAGLEVFWRDEHEEVGGAGGDRTHDITDYESGALTTELPPRGSSSDATASASARSACAMFPL